MTADRCELCQREVKLTKHHLIPKTRHKNKKNKRTFSRAEVHSRVLWICRPCHSNIHVVFTEKELEAEYNTREALLGHPMIRKFCDWIRSKPAGTRVPMKKSNRKTKRRP